MHTLLVDSMLVGEEYMGNATSKRITVSLEDYVIEVAQQKAKIMFKGNLDYYINWLICSNNKQVVIKKVKLIDEDLEKKKPQSITDTVKTAMYNNVCDFCKSPIYQGGEICKAEGYENYIHKKCCKK
jgi:hypothetical protein